MVPSVDARYELNIFRRSRIGSADPATHKIYIWDLSNDGQFSTTLDGGREPLAHIHVRELISLYLFLWPNELQIQWHPVKSLIASTTMHGNILIWHCPKAERWGAFAGGFEEVDENINYEEKEDEFDIVCVLFSLFMIYT